MVEGRKANSIFPSAFLTIYGQLFIDYLVTIDLEVGGIYYTPNEHFVLEADLLGGVSTGCVLVAFSERI